MKNLTYAPYNTFLHTGFTIWRQFFAENFRLESFKAELSLRLASRLKTPLRFGFRTKDPNGKCAKNVSLFCGPTWDCVASDETSLRQ